MVFFVMLGWVRNRYAKLQIVSRLRDAWREFIRFGEETKFMVAGVGVRLE